MCPTESSHCRDQDQHWLRFNNNDIQIWWNTRKEWSMLPLSSFSRNSHNWKLNVLQKVHCGIARICMSFIIVVEILLNDMWTRGYNWDSDIHYEIDSSRYKVPCGGFIALTLVIKHFQTKFPEMKTSKSFCNANVFKSSDI